MNPITEMRRLLGPDGEHWCQGAWWQDGKMCLSGAARVALNGTPEIGGITEDWQFRGWRRIRDLLATTARELSPGIPATGFITVNDDPKRTWQDIDLILKHAEAKWEEQRNMPEVNPCPMCGDGNGPICKECWETMLIPAE